MEALKRQNDRVMRLEPRRDSSQPWPPMESEDSLRLRVSPIGELRLLAKLVQIEAERGILTSTLERLKD